MLPKKNFVIIIFGGFNVFSSSTHWTMNIKDILSLKPTLLVTTKIGELDIGPSITKGKVQEIWWLFF